MHKDVRMNTGLFSKEKGTVAEWDGQWTTMHPRHTVLCFGQPLLYLRGVQESFFVISFE